MWHIFVVCPWGGTALLVCFLVVKFRAITKVSECILFFWYPCCGQGIFSGALAQGWGRGENKHCTLVLVPSWSFSHFHFFLRMSSSALSLACPLLFVLSGLCSVTRWLNSPLFSLSCRRLCSPSHTITNVVCRPCDTFLGLSVGWYSPTSLFFSVVKFRAITKVSEYI